MTQYLLNIQQPSDGEPPSPEALEPIMQACDDLVREMKAAGVWVFNGGLAPPSTATVVRPEGDDVLTTDGPYAEGNRMSAVLSPGVCGCLRYCCGG